MLKWVIGIALGAGLAMSPLAVVAQTDQSAAPAVAPQKTGPHHPRRHMQRRRMHMQRTGHMPPHPAAEAPKTQ